MRAIIRRLIYRPGESKAQRIWLNSINLLSLIVALIWLRLTPWPINGIAFALDVVLLTTAWAIGDHALHVRQQIAYGEIEEPDPTRSRWARFEWRLLHCRRGDHWWQYGSFTSVRGEEPIRSCGVCYKTEMETRAWVQVTIGH